jgi:hypothetical protein
METIRYIRQREEAVQQCISDRWMDKWIQQGLSDRDEGIQQGLSDRGMNGYNKGHQIGMKGYNNVYQIEG